MVPASSAGRRASVSHKEEHAECEGVCVCVCVCEVSNVSFWARSAKNTIKTGVSHNNKLFFSLLTFFFCFKYLILTLLLLL